MNFKDSQFYTTETVGRTREKTPEGYLLCKGVPISRTGAYEYSAAEAGMGHRGRVQLTRTADELFSDDTMRSFEGKPVVIGHDRFATPKNWRQVSVGIVQNVHRDGDTLRADLLLTDEHAIKRVEDGELNEVSCGYDAEVIDDGNGRGHHSGIVGNHLALVPKARVKGCRIGDSADMATNLKTVLRRLFKDGDEEKFNEVLDDIEVENPEDEQTAENPEDTERLEDEELGEGDRVAALEAKVNALVETVEKMAATLGEQHQPVEDEDDDLRFGNESEPEGNEQPMEENPEDEQIVDSDEVSEILTDADTICEGLKRPVGDAAFGRYTRGSMNRVKRIALRRSGLTFFGDAATLDGAALDTAFKGAVALVKATRNPKARTTVGDSAPVNTIAAINQRNREFWSKNK